MKIPTTSLALICVFFLSCGKDTITETNRSHIEEKKSDHTKKSSLDTKSNNNFSEKKPFNASFGKENIKGIINNGVITIDYSSELQGSIKLLRFDGSTKPNQLPFSKSHCDEIRAMAKHGAGLLVRTAYHSILSFEIPVVTSSSFVAEFAKNKSHMLGYSIPEITINNPIIYYQGDIKIILNENSISNLTGNIGYLENQLNLSTKGTSTDLFHKQLIVISGDIICDIASKLAKVEMSYPIKGEDRKIKVIFDTLDPSID